MGSVRLYFARDSLCNENKQPFHSILDRSPPRSTRTAPSAVHQDGGVKYATGASSRIRGRQHHHRHMEHKDTKGSRETPGTNTRNGQVQTEHPWTVKCDGRTLAKQQQRKDTRFSSLEKKANTSMCWTSCSQEHREHCHGMWPCFQQAYNRPPEGNPFQHHNSTSIRPHVRL